MSTGQCTDGNWIELRITPRVIVFYTNGIYQIKSGTRKSRSLRIQFLPSKQIDTIHNKQNQLHWRAAINIKSDTRDDYILGTGYCRIFYKLKSVKYIQKPDYIILIMKNLWNIDINYNFISNLVLHKIWMFYNDYNEQFFDELDKNNHKTSMEMKMELISTYNSQEFSSDIEFKDGLKHGRRIMDDYGHNFLNYMFHSKYYKSLENMAIRTLTLTCRESYGFNFCEMGMIQRCDKLVNMTKFDGITSFSDEYFSYIDSLKK